MVNWIVNNTLTSSGILTPKLNNKSGYVWSFLLSARDHSNWSVITQESLDNINWYDTSGNLTLSGLSLTQHVIRTIDVSSPYIRFKIALVSGSDQPININYVRTDN